MRSPIIEALAEANRIFMVTRRDGSTTPSDDEVREFGRLADHLYKELDEDNGGPLHVQLEDGNVNHMVGQLADDKIIEFVNALRIIAEGNAPAENDHRFKWMYQLAHYYQDKSETLRCAIKILEITRHWSENDAETIYDLWSDTMYGDDGWLARQRRGEAPDA